MRIHLKRQSGSCDEPDDNYLSFRSRDPNFLKTNVVCRIHTVKRCNACILLHEVLRYIEVEFLITYSFSCLVQIFNKRIR